METPARRATSLIVAMCNRFQQSVPHKACQCKQSCPARAGAPQFPGLDPLLGSAVQLLLPASRHSSVSAGSVPNPLAYCLGRTRLRLSRRHGAVRTPAEHVYAPVGSPLSFGVPDFDLFERPGGTGGDCVPSFAVTRNEGVRSSNPRVGSSGFAGVLPGELLKRVSVDNVEQRAVAFEVLGDRPLACAALVRVATRRVVSAKDGGE